MQSLFARRVEPDRHSWIGEARAISHEENQSIGCGTESVAGVPCEPPDEGKQANGCRDDSSRMFPHALGTTRPSLRAHTVPKTSTPSSSSIVGALTVVGMTESPHSVPDSITIPCSAMSGPPIRQLGPM